MIGLIGKKMGMTQTFEDGGRVMPVTVIEAGPCVVVQKKVSADCGYDAIQLGFEGTKPNKINKSLSGHFKKFKLKPMKMLSELRVDDVNSFKEGAEIKVDIFSDSKYVDISGISKGKGFTGVMKRHGFSGLGASHGVHGKHRSPGSIGASAFPARVFKGMKMAGRKGNEKVTVKHLRVVEIIPEQNLLLVKGAVPGAKGSYVMITAS